MISPPVMNNIRSKNIAWLEDYMQRQAGLTPKGLTRIPAFGLVNVAVGELGVTEKTAQSYVDCLIRSGRYKFDRQNFIVVKKGGGE